MNTTINQFSVGASRGFTLIELMIVIAIIGILAAVAVPNYRTYTERSHFVEVIAATSSYKGPMDVAMNLGRATTLDDLDGGTNGIPPNITAGNAVGDVLESLTVTNGSIVAVGTAVVNNAVYKLDANLLAGGGIRWTEDASVANACQSRGLC